MPHQPSHPTPVARTLPAVLALFCAGCAQTGLSLSADPGAAAVHETASLAAPLKAFREPARAISGEPAAAVKGAVADAIAEARTLRLAGKRRDALAVLDAAAEREPKDQLLAKERGLLALETGKVQQAEALLRKALDPEAPDWRLHSALGAALASQGRQADAQIQLGKALEIAPEHPSVLNNLALSYALDGKHAEAERLLKRVAQTADAEPKAKANLALILGLNGKIGEARKIAGAALPPETARANVGYLESLAAREARAHVSRAEPGQTAGIASTRSPD